MGDEPEVIVTPEMVGAGVSSVRGKPGTWESDVESIYRAMAALDPDRATTLTLAPDARMVEERDAALKTQIDYGDRLVVCQFELIERNNEVFLLRQALAAKDARIAELKSVLASGGHL